MFSGAQNNNNIFNNQQNNNNIFNNQQNNNNNQQNNNNNINNNNFNNKDNEFKNKFNEVKKLFNEINNEKSIKKFKKDSNLNNINLNLNSFVHYFPNNKIFSNKNLDQLIALTKNKKKNLEKNLKNENININLSTKLNLKNIENEIEEILKISSFNNDMKKIYNNNNNKININQKNKIIDINELFIEHNNNLINERISINNNKNNNNNNITLKLCKFNFNYDNEIYLNDKNDENYINNFFDSNRKNFIDISKSKKNYNNNLFINNNNNNYNKNIIFDNNNNYNNENNQEKNLFEFYSEIITNNFSKQNLNNNNNYNLSNLETIKNIVKYLSLNFKKNRKNLFSLLFNQISSNPFTSKNIIKNTIKFYENLFKEKLINGIPYNLNSYENIKKAIEEYSQIVIYSNYQNISQTNNNDLFLWGKIYYFLRAGFFNECIQFINENKNYNNNRELISFLLILNKYNFINFNEENEEDDLIDNNNNEDEETIIENLMEIYKILMNPQNNLKETNPFQHICFTLITKKHNILNNFILEDFNDYIWFHLNIINSEKKIYKKIIDDEGVLTLKKFQNHIINANKEDIIKKSNNFFIDYLQINFSLLLYKNGLKFISEFNNNNNIENNIDFINLFFILNKINLNIDFSNLSNEIINSEIETETDDEISEKFVSKILMFNSRYLKEVIFYLKYSDKNYLDNIAKLILINDNFDIFLPIKIESSTFSKNKTKILQIEKILEENEVKNLLIKITKSFVENSNDFINFDSFDHLLNVIKYYKMINELILLLFHFFIFILKKKFPPKILNFNQDENEFFINEKNILFKYKNLLNEINNFIINNNNNKEIEFVEYFYEILEQLEILEEIFDLINFNKDEIAFEIFIKKIVFIQINKININRFIEDFYKNFNNDLKSFFPEICLIYFYLLNYKRENFIYDKFNNFDLNELKTKIYELISLVKILKEINNINPNEKNIYEFIIENYHNSLLNN